MARLTYVEAVINRLKAFKTGITNNAASWTGQPDTPATTQAHIDALETADAEILALENQLSQKRTALKTLTQTKSGVADTIELRVKGIHAAAPSKWLEYGLPDPTSDAAQQRNAREVCGKGIIKTVIDDYDAVGFIVEWEKLADAETYEVERGIAADASDVNTIPAFTHLVTIRKVKYTDDDVEKGKRYFYRIRGINARGAGEWSEAVSRVQ
jgi:hypothetical protein